MEIPPVKLLVTKKQLFVKTRNDSIQLKEMSMKMYLIAYMIFMTRISFQGTKSVS